jgi:hypothetical protein
LTGKATYRDFIKAGADFIFDDATKILECILTGEGGEKEIAEDRKT